MLMTSGQIREHSFLMKLAGNLIFESRKSRTISVTPGVRLELSEVSYMNISPGKDLYGLLVSQY